MDVVVNKTEDLDKILLTLTYTLIIKTIKKCINLVS